MVFQYSRAYKSYHNGNVNFIKDIDNGCFMAYKSYHNGM